MEHDRPNAFCSWPKNTAIIPHGNLSRLVRIKSLTGGKKRSPPS